MAMTEEQYKAFMEEYFKNNHIPDRDRHKWDAGTKQLLGIREQELTKQQEDAREAYLYKTGNPDYFIQSNKKYTYKLPPPEPEEEIEPDYSLHRMCEDCYDLKYGKSQREALWKTYKHLLSEQEPCHYCFNPTRFLAAIEENRRECSFLHLEREDDE